jgi:WD40 repeat protein
MQHFDTPAISPDGSLAAYAQRGIPVARQVVTMREADTGATRATIPLDPADPVRQLAFTADGSKLLVRTDSRVVQLFDAATGAPAGELANTGRPCVTGIAAHPRGPVACARTNGTVTFWDAERREQLRTLDWQAGKLVSVAFSPDGALAAAGTEDGKLVVWDVDP